MKFSDKFKIRVLLICLTSEIGHGFYHPGSYPPKYVVGEPISVKLTSLTSTSTPIPYNYYTLPFCKPQLGLRDTAETFLELLTGDWIQNSPYKFSMYTNQTQIFLCQTKPLSSEDYTLLTKRIEESYQVNLFLDDLPVIYVTNYPMWSGHPIGFKISDSYYVFNHLKFTVFVHEYEEMKVTPCSVHHNQESLKNLKTYDKYPFKIDCEDNVGYVALKENEPVAFTYEVRFIESDIKWASRWDAYMKMEGGKVQSFSVLNSLMVIAFLAGIFFLIFLRTVIRELYILLEPIKSLVKFMLKSTHFGL